MNNCPHCHAALTDEYCKLCGWLSDELLELHERLTRTAAVVRLTGWPTPPEPPPALPMRALTQAPRIPLHRPARPGWDAIVIRQGVPKP